MRTIKTTIYQFDELSDQAKERARDWYRNGMEFAWSDDSLNSIKYFCDHFGVTLKDWSVGAYYPIDYSTNAENKHFRGLKLASVDRDYTPTGYCLDCALWGTFHSVFKDTGNALQAFNDALNAGFGEWRSDMEYQLSDESIDENICCNEYEFNENGGRV